MDSTNAPNDLQKHFRNPYFDKKRDKNCFNQSGLKALICLFGFLQAPERFGIHLFM